MYGLHDLLMRRITLSESGRDSFFDPPRESHCSPGYWVSVAARARDRNLSVADLNIPADRSGYAKAIGIETALNQRDRYPFGRRHQGQTYSPLVVIADRSDVDKAVADVSGCVRAQFPEQDLCGFVGDLCSVIGDLHDNVWSHAESTGISVAQRWAQPGTNREHHIVEFAVADCGRGLFRELQRSGVSRRHSIASDEQAIDWCIQKGHSSKIREDDGWSQQLPEDAMGNPIGPNARAFSTGNHHMGLGLYKLTSLVERYAGRLWIASGDTLLSVDGSGTKTYIQVPCHWQGVTLACRFYTGRVRQRVADQKADELSLSLLELMGSPP